jgi:hypothetical protein
LNRHPFLLIVAITLLACARPAPVAHDGPSLRQGEPVSAIALEQEVRRLAAPNATKATHWPGFDPIAIPLAVFDGEQTYLFRHPSPPAEFTLVPATTPAVYVTKGQHQAITANSSAEIGGVSTATVILDQSQSMRAIVDIAAMATHEAFHVYQRAKHPGWVGNEADLFTYPIDSAELLALRRLETDALRQALAAEDAESAKCWARQALALRNDRYAKMEPAYGDYERGTELNEGLATYVEMKAAGRKSVTLPPEEFGPADVRKRAYATGPALALLLDRFVPEWPVSFETNDKQTLDAAVGAAVGPGNTCTAGDAALVDAQQKARADIAALAEQWAQKLAAFEGKAGWRVIVEAGGSEPLWPQGFDPLNVDRIAAQRVLHRRFVRLGNGAGNLEVMNAEALTDGVGPHPLFQGVKRVVLTGLAEPKVSESGDKVSVQTPGLTLEFKGARITRNGEVMTVRVGS